MSKEITKTKHRPILWSLLVTNFVMTQNKLGTTQLDTRRVVKSARFISRGKMNFNQHGFIKKNIALSYLCRYSIKVLVYPGSAPSLKFNASIKPIYQNIGQDQKVYTRLEERTLVLLVKTCSKSCYHTALWTITSTMCPRIFHLRTLC